MSYSKGSGENERNPSTVGHVFRHIWYTLSGADLYQSNQLASDCDSRIKLCTSFGIDGHYSPRSPDARGKHHPDFFIQRATLCQLDCRPGLMAYEEFATYDFDGYERFVVVALVVCIRLTKSYFNEC